MTMTRDGGYTSYGSDSSNGFIPELWSGKLVERFYASTVFGSIASTDYEGEIKDHGDLVNIRTVPDITISNYTVGQALNYEQPDSALVSLSINKGKYFAFKVDDVDAYQSDLNLMDGWADAGGSSMKVAVDTDILGAIYADVAAANKGLTAGAISGDINLGVTGTPFALSKTNVLDFIVDLGVVLDEQNVPEEGRWLVMPAWACGMVKKSDLKDASLTGDGSSILRSGRIGMIDRFEVFMSNNVATTTDGPDTVHNLVAGHKAGLTFASQMTKLETLPNPDSFGQLIRGLNVFGYKVIEGKFLAHGYVKRG